jgi:nucleotide-binding universal stress UspA family protein
VGVTTPFERIVVAYDASPNAEMALDRAIAMARSWSVPLTILTVMPGPVLWAVGPMPPVLPNDETERAIHELLEKARLKAEASGAREVSSVALSGHAADEILKYLDEEHVDLIVMGSRGYSPVGRLLLGSVSDAVVHHTHSAVLIVRPVAGPSRS